MALIMLIFVIIYYNRRSKYQRLVATDFPNIQSSAFEKWRNLRLKSIDIFLWFAGGLIAINLVGIGALRFSPIISSDSLTELLILAFFIGLIWSVVYDTKASKLQKQLKIELPKKH